MTQKAPAVPDTNSLAHRQLPQKVWVCSAVDGLKKLPAACMEMSPVADKEVLGNPGTRRSDPLGHDRCSSSFNTPCMSHWWGYTMWLLLPHTAKSVDLKGGKIGSNVNLSAQSPGEKGRGGITRRYSSQEI